MVNAHRLRAAVRYLSFSSPPWKWKLARSHCPLCGPALFVSLRASGHLTRCTSCRATVLNLALIPVIRGHLSRSGVDARCASAYELSTYGSTLAFLQRAFGTVCTSEFDPTRERGTIRDGVMNQDVQALTFADAEFDLVTCNQVFEHVPDDREAYRECLRVLKPGGTLIFSVPFYDRAETEQVARVRDGAIEWLGTPEYHDSRLEGPRSAPVFWRHSQRDIVARVAAAGFHSVTLIDVVLSSCQRQPAQVVYAVK